MKDIDIFDKEKIKELVDKDTIVDFDCNNNEKKVYIALKMPDPKDEFSGLFS